MDKKYIALYRSAAVRDVQICMGDPDTDDVLWDDGLWSDCPEAEVYIGTCIGSSAEAVLHNVAAREGCNENAIRLIPIEDCKPEDYDATAVCRATNGPCCWCKPGPCDSRRITANEAKDSEPELDYMVRFAIEADFDMEELPASQLHALWVAYCFHNNLDTDTRGYDLALAWLWEAVKDKNCSVWRDFDSFQSYMCEDLV